MKSVPRSSQHTVEFTASLPFSQHSHPKLPYRAEMLFSQEFRDAISIVV